MSDNKTELESTELAGVRTRVIYDKGNNPAMPTILYHPGIFGRLEKFSTQSIPRIALETGCSLLALNTIDQDPSGEYPPRDIDYGLCLKMAEQAITQIDTRSGVIPILNSWGSRPLTMTLDKHRGIEVAGVVGIGATLNAHKVLEAGLQQYFSLGVLGEDAKKAYESGETISGIPYPPPPESDTKVSISRRFFEAHNDVPFSEEPIHVKGKIICIRGENDEHVNEADTQGIAAMYKNSVEAEQVQTQGGHWGNKDAPVEAALRRVIQSVHIK